MKYTLLFISLIWASSCFAQWETDPTINNIVYTGIGDQNAQQIISDGNSGTFVAWIAQSDGFLPSMIKVQRLNEDGSILWDSSGITASPNVIGDVASYKIIADGTGGAVIVWSANDDAITTNNIYAQRIDEDGNIQWDTAGVIICGESGSQGNPDVVADGAGNYIATWHDNRSPITNNDIYAQKFDSDGSTYWDPGGVLVCNASYVQYDPKIAMDGSGGALLTWLDGRHFPGQSSIYAQRIDADGNAQWAANGIRIDATIKSIRAPLLIGDGHHGALISYIKSSAAADPFLNCQHVDSAGNLLWGAYGTVMSDSTLSEAYSISGDSKNGLIAVWEDLRSVRDIYIQKIDSSGAVSWAAGGLPVCSFSGTQFNPSIAVDPDGNAGVVWEDNRSGSGSFDIYGQVVSPDGTMNLLDDGAPVCTASSDKRRPMISFNNGNFITTWVDYRNVNADLYASKLDFDEPLPLAIISFTALLKNNEVDLKWACAMEEIGMKYFVQRSTDGKTFSDIGQRSANNSNVHQYLFIDDKLNGLQAGEVFYRLRIQSENGPLTYSEVREISLNKYPMLKIYPNPATNIVTLNEDVKSLWINDINGKVISQRSDNLTRQIDVSYLPSGVYTIHAINNANIHETSPLIIK